MDIERRDDDIVYFESLEGAVLSIDIDGSPCTVDPTSLQSLTEIRDHASGVDPDEIAAVLGYPVGTFDGVPSITAEWTGRNCRTPSSIPGPG